MKLRRFFGLLRREFQEHPNLFVIAPLGLALLTGLVNLWLLLGFMEGDMDFLEDWLPNLAEWVVDLSVAQISLALFPFTLPFAALLGFCIIIYLGGTLYQDRRDLSVLFWQSMPVSNLAAVLSKIVTVVLIAPLSYMAVVLLLYLLGLGAFAYMEWNQSLEAAEMLKLLQAVLRSLALMYLTIVLSVLLLFPMVGWILLFSAFAKRTPLLWALGVFLLLGLLEDLLFGSQYLADWTATRAAQWDFVISSSTGFFSGLLTEDFLYEMGIGIAVGSILVTGAVLMRRYID